MKDASSDARPLTTAEGTGDAMHRLIVDLYPVCRSITGNGIRTSLLRLQENVKLAIHEVPKAITDAGFRVEYQGRLRKEQPHGEGCGLPNFKPSRHELQRACEHPDAPDGAPATPLFPS